MNIFSKQTTSVIPSGELKHLSVDELKPSSTNPRMLFDPEPLKDLKESIRTHGVLVPITVFKIKGQEMYAILDGERRYKCCKELREEGKDVKIPANVVPTPDKIAGILYMFSIHNFREQWQLMPTALSLQEVINNLNENDNKKLSSLTGLSETQVERCRWLLSYPKRFQEMSLVQDPSSRIPANFWIEAYPVLKIYEEELPVYMQQKGREALTQIFVDKYRNKKIVSVIHFRRIREAYVRAKDNPAKHTEMVEALKQFADDSKLEIRDTFDKFLPKREVNTALKACSEFKERLDKLKLDLATDNKDELVSALNDVRKYLDNILLELNSSVIEENNES